MERREYSRIRINADSLFYLSKDESANRDFCGVIEDISEVGIKVVVFEDKYLSLVQGIELGTELYFQAVDIYSCYDEERTDIIEGKATVVRIEQQGEQYMFGCKMAVLDKELAKYIDDRKVSLLFQRELVDYHFL